MPAWITSLLRELVSVPIMVCGLEHDHLAPGQRQLARHGEADDAGADHDAVDPFHASDPLVALSGLYSEQGVDVGVRHARGPRRRQDVGPAALVDLDALGQALAPAALLGLARHQDLGEARRAAAPP